MSFHSWFYKSEKKLLQQEEALPKNRKAPLVAVALFSKQKQN